MSDTPPTTSETPRTDAHIEQENLYPWLVKSNFARQLERELNEANRSSALDRQLLATNKLITPSLLEHYESLEQQLTTALDRVKSLEATCAELVTDGNAITLAENLHKMEARVKELEKDKERLDWLNKAVFSPDNTVWIDGINLANSVNIYQAIDSAIQQEKDSTHFSPLGVVKV